MASSGSSFNFLPLGAIIQSFHVNGKNIVLGFDSAEQYKEHNAPYFGETIGRIANRVSGAKINNLNGKSYKLAANNGPNALHGGPLGWGKRTFTESKDVRGGKDTHLFKYTSSDGEEGYPGTVEVRVWYTHSTKEENGVRKISLEIEYEAELLDDGSDTRETAINMTNHS